MPRFILALLLSIGFLGLTSPAVAQETDPVVFVMGGSEPGDADQWAIDQLEGAGYAVQVIEDEAFGGDVAASLVVISSSTRPDVLADAPRAFEGPILAWEPALLSALGLTGDNRGEDFDVAGPEAEIDLEGEHPITEGLESPLTFNDERVFVGWGKIEMGTTVATMEGQPVLVVVERGAELIDEGTALGCRVTFPAFSDSLATSNEAGMQLFQRTAAFAMSGCDGAADLGSDTSDTTTTTTTPDDSDDDDDSATTTTTEPLTDVTTSAPGSAEGGGLPSTGTSSSGVFFLFAGFIMIVGYGLIRTSLIFG